MIVGGVLPYLISLLGWVSSFLCAMSESHVSDYSAALLDECTSGQSFFSINGSDNQFYLENFDLILFESVPSPEDYSRGSLSTLLVTESLSP